MSKANRPPIVRLLLPLLFTTLLIAPSCGFKKQVGDACYGTYECTPGLFCSEGKCISPAGQSCTTSSDCPTNFVCRFELCVDRNTLIPCTNQQPCPEDQQLFCKEGFCTKSGEGRNCRSDIECPTGLVCDTSNGSVCRLGQRCEIDDDCNNDNLVCEEQRCVEERNRSECTTSDDCSDEEICVLQASGTGTCESASPP